MAARRKREEEAEFLKLNTTSNPTELDILTFALHLLDPSCPAQTTAAALLERHGKLSDVFDTPAQILAECPGVGPRLASALAAYPDLFRAYMESKNQARTRIVDTKTAFAAVQNKFFGRKTEIVVLLILDSKGYLKYMGIVNEGSVHGVPIYIRQIVRLCLLYDADAVYLAHNHPSGNCTPSRQDIQTTKEIELALSGIDVILSDHFIFTDEDYLSMRATGVLQKLRHDIATLKRQIIT